jgi:hypothetical protein
MHSLRKGPLDGVRAEMQLRIWHRCILPGLAAEPYGILMVVRAADCNDLVDRRESFRTMTFGRAPLADSALLLELGGNKYLSILP